jgi:putative transposase
MGSVGDCYDNTMCESFFATLKCERIDCRTYKMHQQARLDLFVFIEVWYNPHRRDKGIEQKSPINFEVSRTTPKKEWSTQTG